MSDKVPRTAVPILLAVLVAAWPWLGLNTYWQNQVILVVVLMLLVSSLNLSLGYAGELSLAQVALYGGGAYVTGYLAVRGHTDLLLALVLAASVAVIIGVLIGVPALRLGGWSLAMTSFFAVLLIPDVVNMLREQTGGDLGLAGIPVPTLFGQELEPRSFYLAAILVGVLWLAFVRNLLTSRHGPALRVLKESPILASSLGLSVYRTKLKVYMLAAVPAGFAGALYTDLQRYISPAAFGFTVAFTVLAASVLGGSATVYGAVIGAAILQIGVVQTTTFGEYSTLAYGIFLLVFGVAVRSGIIGLTRSVAARVGLRVAPRVPASEPRPLTRLDGAELVVRNVSKRFGGNRALHDVSLAAAPGQITALIGPNGSGKTTLLNILGRFYVQDEGVIQIGHKAAPRAPDVIARLGVARTFQTPRVPPGLSVRDGIAAGLYSRAYVGVLPAVLRLPRYRRQAQADLDQVSEVLDLLDLTDLAESEAAALPLGTRRMFELGRALVSRPAVLLLDEIASGLDESELARLSSLLRTVRDLGCTIVLVEHNFGLVLSIADRIHVLARGEVIASGAPQEIEHNPRVVSEYLGLVDDSTPVEPEQAGVAESLNAKATRVGGDRP